MRNINKLASLLDRAGDYNLADKLDKIAQGGQYFVYPPKFVQPKTNSYSVTGQYSDHIQRYKNLIMKSDFQGATNYYNGVMRSAFTPEQKEAFKAQAERIRNDYNVGEFSDAPKQVLYNGKIINNQKLSQDELSGLLTKHHLYDYSYNRQEFDRRWNELLSDVRNRLTPSIINQLNSTKKIIEQRVK